MIPAPEAANFVPIIFISERWYRAMGSHSLLRLRWLILAVATALIGLSPLAAGAAAEPAGSMPDTEVKVETLDLLIILAYLVGIVALGCWAGMRRKETKGSDYFLAGKSLTWPVIGLALFATNISTIHLVSFAQNGFTSGLTYGNFEWMAAFTLVVLSLFFAPFYLRSSVTTLPDFMEKRYSRGSRDFLAVLSIFSAIVVHIGFSLHTGAIVLEGTVLQSVFGSELVEYRPLTILAMCGVTAVYTIVGGLLAVVLTESIQTIVLLLGSICITLIGFYMIGGWGELTSSVHPVNLSMLRSSHDPTGITWYAVFLGYPVLGVWYWCTDQTIVQRVLGARDENHARIGPLFAGFIKILPVFLFVLPGVVCLGLVNQGKIPPLPTHPDGSPITEWTYTHMIKTMLWPGMQGVIIAAMLAALMSTVSGALNSIATLVSYDIYRRLRPDSDDRHLIRIGRLATFAAMCIAVVWSLVIARLGETIFQAMVDVFPVVAPPTAVVFLWGVFWKRTSARAALATLIGGSCLGLVVYTLKQLNNFGVLDLEAVDPRLASFVAINGLFMAFILFVVESVFIFGASLVWPHRHTEESAQLVWDSPAAALKSHEGTWGGLLDFRVMAVLLVAVMAGLYWGFSDSTIYYPIKGTVGVDGEPVRGATVYLETDDPRLSATLATGLDGQFTFGTKQRAGGAPAGTQYRARIEPTRDFLVRVEGGDPRDVVEVLASMPRGTPVEEETTGGTTHYTIATEPEPTVVDVAAGARVEVLPATDVPARYRRFSTSDLAFTVGEKEMSLDWNLEPKQASTIGAAADLAKTEGRGGSAGAIGRYNGR